MTGSSGEVLGTRSVEVKEIDVEMRRVARDMDSLRQWASISGGVAVKAEECDNLEELLVKARTHAQRSSQVNPRRAPAGMNVWSFVALLGCLGAEWLWRKRVGLM